MFGRISLELSSIFSRFSPWCVKWRTRLQEGTYFIKQTEKASGRIGLAICVLRRLDMSLEDQFILTPEDSNVLHLNVSRGFWESPTEQHQYGIWLPGMGIAAVYGIIFIVGLVGNVTLMKTCLLVKSMRTVPNLFLSSLALGDVLLLVTCAPVDASRYLVDEWLFGRVGCKLIPFIQLTSVGVSVFTLTALSADRYLSHI